MYRLVSGIPGVLFGVASITAYSQAQPNIVIILTDDQGWGDLSINGNTNIKTPNIDRFSGQGAIFSHFYVAPMSSPTRAGLLTGRYPDRTGVYGTSDPAQFMNLDEVTIADLFKKAGYATGCFGKWHNGSQYPYHPNGRGFDEFYGFFGGHRSNYFNTTLYHNGDTVRSTGYLADDLTDKAITFIEDNNNKPFPCYIPYNIPHNPLQVPDKYYDRIRRRGISMYARNPEQEDIDVTIASLAMCENIDWNVGRLLRKIDDLNLASKTIVMYLSDNGPAFWRWNGDMKGKKGDVDEGGVRVPFFIRWPGVIPAGTIVNDNAAYIDLLPTLADIAGLSIQNCKPIDGISLKPLLTGKVDHLPERLLFSSLNNKRSVRRGYYLAEEGSLFNLAIDPGQRLNIAPQFPEIYESLTDTLRKWYVDVIKGIDKTRWYQVGYPQFPVTILPAEDSRLHPSENGKVAYSAPILCNTFIKNWDDTSSFVSWNIEVNTAAAYEVSISYTCAPVNTGCEFEFDFLDNKLMGVISDTHDPPLLSSPDRVERTTQSYEKEFKQMWVGIMHLDQGKGEFILKPKIMKGKQMMDVKAITVKLID